jgi:hypothetical protein
MKTISMSRGLQVLNARVLLALVFACLASACTSVPHLKTASFSGGHFYDQGFKRDRDLRVTPGTPGTPKTVLLTSDQLRQLEVWFQNLGTNWGPLLVTPPVTQTYLILACTNKDEWMLEFYESPENGWEGWRNTVLLRVKNGTDVTKISDQSKQTLLAILRSS